MLFRFSVSIVYLQILYACKGSAVFVEVLIQFRNKLRLTAAHQRIQHLISDDNELPIHVFTSLWVWELLTLYLNSIVK